MTDFDAIPVVDMAPLRVPDAPAHERARVVREIRDACERVGFFYIRNHGVDEALLRAAHSAARWFFALPVDVKQHVAIANAPELHRGYCGLLQEATDPEAGGDWKEGFDVGRELSHGDALVDAGVPLHGPNQWPSEGDAPGFRAAVYGLFDAFVQLGRVLVSALEESLGVERGALLGKFEQPLALMRLLHYPPGMSREAGAVSGNAEGMGCGAHTDYGCLTILDQDDVGGLQVMNGAGKWIDAVPMEGTFVVNLGDMLERWTNGRFKATRHRVQSSAHSHRYSIPFFFEPSFDALVSVLPSCVGSNEQPRYPPQQYGPYLLNRLDDTFTYRSEERSAQAVAH